MNSGLPPNSELSTAAPVTPLAYFALAILTALLVALYRWAATKIGVIDRPTQRSSHRRATVSGAGIVLAAVFLFLLTLLLYRNTIAVNIAWLFAMASCIAIFGWLDDRFHLSIRLRFAVYSIFAIASVALIGVQPPILAIAAALFVLAHVNLFNFMDGIDGLAICQAVFCCTAAAWLMQSNVASDLVPISAGLAAIGLGALVWNWAPAKVFLGDAGSIFFGLSLAVLAIHSAVEGSLHFVTWLILFAAFISDSAITLIARALAGEKIYQAHRTHVYQLLAQRLNSHAAVTCVYMLINLAFLLPLAMLAEHSELRRYYYLSIAYVPLIVIVYSSRKRLLCFQADNL
ncbi:MAG: MraY family glycosyltransferase [Pseudomonadales bacterium]